MRQIRQLFEHLDQRGLLVLGILWIGLEFFVLGPFSAITTGDNADVIIPDLMSFAFTDNGFALWNRFTMSGTDRQAMGSLSPIDIWLFSHLPAWLAYQLRVMSQIGLAAFAMAGICRKWMGMEKAGAIFAGLSYAIIVGASGRIYLSVLAYLPLFLLTLGLVLENKRSPARWISLIVATCLLGLSAHMGYLFPFPQALIGIWFLFIVRKTAAVDWLIIVSAPTLAALLRLDDYRSMAAEALLSRRYETTLTINADPLREAALSASSILFGTPEKVVVAVLAITGCLYLGRYPVVRRLMIGAALIACAVLGVAVLNDTLFAIFPFARGFNLNRLWTMVSFLAVILAGFGVQGLAAQPANSMTSARSWIFGWPRGRIVVGIAFSALFASSLHYKYGNAKDWISQGNMVQNFASQQLEDLADRIQAQPLPARVGVYQLYPNYLHAYGMETPGGYLSMVAGRYSHYWAKMLEPSLRGGSAEGVARLFVLYGNRLMLGSEQKLTSVELQNHFNLALLSLANVKYFVSRDPLSDPQLRLLDGGARPWNSRSLKEKILASAKANFTGRENLYIYQNKQALERFFIAPNVRQFSSTDELLNSLGQASISTLGSTAFINARNVPAAMGADLQNLHAGTLSLAGYDSDRIELTLHTDGPALLVLTNSYNAKWQARVDGVEVPIIPVDHTFMGVLLPSGARNIVFQYGAD